MQLKAILFVTVLAIPLMNVQAQDRLPTAITEKEMPKLGEKKNMGWHPTAKVGLNGALSESSGVVGQPDGTSQTYGLNLAGSYNFVSESQEWQNTLTYVGATSKTATIPKYVKSNDELRFESLYLYSIPSVPQIGPYAKVSAKAPVFNGEDARANPVTYVITTRSGSTINVPNTSTLHLTDGFKPLTTRESGGFFYKPIDTTPIRVDLRLGVGAEQVAAGGQYAVTGTNADGSVAVKELTPISQLGLEVGVAAKGKIDDRSSWSVGVETLTPFVNNKAADDHRDALRLTDIDGFAKFSTALASWASLNYDYKLSIEPQLVDRAQQTSMVVLNINYDLL